MNEAARLNQKAVVLETGTDRAGVKWEVVEADTRFYVRFNGDCCHGPFKTRDRAIEYAKFEG